MNKHLKNLNRIEFVVTNACTGKCKHCSQGDHNSHDKIDKSSASDAVRKIAREYDIKSVMTFGGEPLLCSEIVCEIHKAAREMNIPKRQLITNGYFTNDIDRIKFVANEIINSGVNEILLSADAFHQEIIPLSLVMKFAECVNSADITFKVHPAWLVSSEEDNLYNVKTREILDEFNRIGIETGEGNVIFPSGNALKYLGDYFDLNKKTINPYVEDPNDIHAICFSANGNILGENFYNKDIIDILNKYNPNNKTNL